MYMYILNKDLHGSIFIKTLATWYNHTVCKHIAQLIINLFYPVLVVFLSIVGQDCDLPKQQSV